MSRPSSFVLATILIAFLALYGGLPYLKHGLYLDIHEGDTYHLLDILFRMSEGAVPHEDFMTPLGVVAFAPFLAFMNAGHSAGMSIIFGQLVVGLILLPIAVYAARTRLSRPVGLYFGLLVVGLAVALTYGGAKAGIAISMFYNRWAWAIAFLVVVLAFIPPAKEDRAGLESALIGVLCGALLMLKVTYFVAVVPAIAVALFARCRLKGILVATLAGGVVLAIATAWLGVAYWPGYLGDLRVVSNNELRPNVGVPFNVILSGPGFIGGTFVLAFSVFCLRKTGHDSLAVALLVLAPGLIFITYQNFGNDPMWLWLMPVLLLSLRPGAAQSQVYGFDARRVMEMTAVVALALNFPSLYKSTLSNLDHMAFSEATFVDMLPEGDQGAQDIFVRKGRAYTMTAEVDLDRTMPDWSKYSDAVEREPLKEIGGTVIDACEWRAGVLGYMETIAERLQADGVAEGSQLFVTDVVTSLHFFGPFEPLKGGAPWYYGELSGLENADYVVVPKCAVSTRYRGVMIDELAASDARLEPVSENALYVLLAVNFSR